MDLREILLLVFGPINLVFATLVYVHSNKRAVVAFYALISVFASLWSFATLLTGIPNLPLRFFSYALHAHYIFGYLAYLSFFWFALYYPHRSARSLLFPLLLTAATFVFLALIPTSSLIYQSIHSGKGIADRIAFNLPGYAAFIVMLSGVFFAGLLILLRKFTRTTREERYREFDPYQIYFAILANFIAGVLGITFNLLFPLYGDFSLFYVNPILVTFALTAIGIYNLLKYNLFNVKVILTELFTIAIWVIFFLRIAIAPSAQERIANIVLLLATIVFGIFLIRSVLKEVHAREEIERLAKDLEKANARLRELDKLKSEFVSIASHQLRSPITAIRGYASLLLEGSFGAVPAGIKEALERIAESSKNMALSVEDFLNVSRIEQGRMKYEMSEFDMREMVGEVVEELRPVIEQKGLSIAIKQDQGTHKVLADPGKIKQVIGNLIDNSVKYTPRGSISIAVGADNRRAMVITSISDTGVGMSKATLGKLFDKFTRAENANEVNVMGTGLGLYVAKQMVEAHRGRIIATSPGEGKGSTFTVELPAKG